MLLRLFVVASLLVTFTLACGEAVEDEVSTAVPTATPTAGPPLDAEDYARAMEEIVLVQPGASDTATNLFIDLYNPENAAKLDLLRAHEEWTEDDILFAGEFARSQLRVLSEQYDILYDSYTRALDQAAALNPRDSMRDLHFEIIDLVRARLDVEREVVERIGRTDADLRSMDDFNVFSGILNSMTSQGLHNYAPDLADKGDELDARRDEACDALVDVLWDELSRYVDLGICRRYL